MGKKKKAKSRRSKECKKEQFPSPNSCLPKDVLEKLEAEIKEANELLLDLALSGERTLDESFSEAFKGLIGQVVELKLNCENECEVQEEEEEEGEEDTLTVTGRVFLAGTNFCSLKSDEKERLVPYESICFIYPNNRFAKPIHEPALLDIGPLFRKCLTTDFGSIVSGSPELIQLFYGLDLAVYLLRFINEDLVVHIGNKKNQGILKCVDKSSLVLCIEEENQLISFGDLCFIELKK
ncbi:hypothetical protein [Guptibacillus hwajinpoensis]|uniref:Uncharacterized protein n=1 Tax=Guptibacillus hwajinpoensis TaxID=208199 RepID=A0A0J6CV14_9BACL|nr:hypothetical protein [Alkalihalobacillus macyae]KMM37028.1 hypothetical protein AB986_14115 [Alkalihalobacillus macyae]